MQVVAQGQKGVPEEVRFKPHGGCEGRTPELSDLPAGDDASKAVQESGLLQEPWQLVYEGATYGLLPFIQGNVGQQHQGRIAGGFVQPSPSQPAVGQETLETPDDFFGPLEF